jgi:hypothetical protein
MWTGIHRGGHSAIVVLDARGPREAVRRGQRHGKRQELHYGNADQVGLVGRSRVGRSVGSTTASVV